MADLIVDVSHPVAIVGGADLASQHINILQTLTEVFVAADGGADHLLAKDIVPEAVIGDLDSISPLTRQRLLPQLVEICDTDTTDLEKVLARVSAPVIIGAGFLGGRLDHTFASLSAIAKSADKSLILLSDTELCFRCPDAGLMLDLPEGTPLAVLPMEALTATTAGLRWDMQDTPLAPAGFVSSSNETVARAVRISVTGPALITLPMAQLGPAIAAVRAK